MTSFCVLLFDLHFFFCLLISTAHFPLTSHGCNEQDRRALLDFKSSLSDPANRLSSWQDSYQHQNCCNWKGVGCSYDSFRVISIRLRNTAASLTGKLSPSLFNVSHLEYIDLAYNNFQETQIPLELSNLKKLSHLDLSESNIGSSISTQFNNLSSLHLLDLSGNTYLESSSMKWVRGLVNLQVFNLSGIDISEENFAEHISHLSNLRDLDLSGCSISSTTFPSFHNLSYLSSLDMSFNYHLNSEIPVQLGNLTSLSTLYLSDCGLQGSVPYLPQLKELDVSGNRDLNPDLTRMFQRQWPKLQKLTISETNVSGSIPISISNAPLLVSLSAGRCSIQGSLPSSIYNLSQLQSLDLNNNNISGYIQPSISNLKFLTTLDLSENKFQGFLPKSIFNLKFLNILRLSYNNLQGSIPSSICKILSLEVLSLESNNITGTIPSCISKLRNLTVFSVYENSIGGNVSLISLMNDLDLTTIDLHSNRLTVVIDQNISLYAKFILEKLVLPSCNLKGLFPTFICKLSNLGSLDLSHNNLTGVIPSCVSKLQNLYSSFDVSNNKLSGEISAEIGVTLSNLEVINLAGNEFSGSIPSSICSNTPIYSTSTIDLSNNKFSGVIPNTIGNCRNLQSLNLGNNSLNGNVPNEIGQLEFLNYLQLQDNYLEGTITFISKFPLLDVLSLANNHFEGNIPRALFGPEHAYVRIISLRSNKLNGSLPNEIRLSHLIILDLSDNQLSGHIPKKLGTYWMNLPSYSSVQLTDQRNENDIQIQMVINGIMVHFQKVYPYDSVLDLSRNMFEGNIPTRIGRLLKGLRRLNLSHNHLSGNLPVSIANMSHLVSLDLSFNRLSGQIPRSLTSLDFLGFLNLSYNELSGKIPRGTHFDTLGVDGWAFSGNALLCGEPTKKVCEVDEDNQDDDQEDASDKLIFYSIVFLGFVVGFWGPFLVMLIKKQKLWFPYWRFIDYVVAVIIRCIQNK